jgi:hypothetical protein
MAIARINGPMLQANLERQGTNIQIDLAAYFDVNNYRVGVNNTNPQYTLDITGNAHLGNLYILGNAITTDSGKKLNLGAITNLTVTGGSPNYIVYTDGTGNLNFGNLSTLSQLEVFTGNNVVLGTNTQGALASNAGSFTTQTTVTDSIAILNQILGYITNSSGSNIHVSGNVAAGNVISTFYGTQYGDSTGNVYGYVLTAGQPYITSLGTLSSLAVTANTTSGNVVSTFYGNLYGNVATPAQPYITSIGTLSNLAVTANITSGNVVSTFYGNLYGNVNAPGQPYITSLGTLTNLAVLGNTTSGNIGGVFYGNIHTDYIFSNTATVTVFNTTSAIGLPVGSNVQYPSSNSAGYIRFNNSIGTVEFYTGTAWQPLTNTISDQQITPTGATAVYQLTQAAVAEGILVSINGTVQRPGSAYSVSGTTITFTETPLVTDIIDIRYIASATVVTLAGLAEDITTTGNIVGGTIATTALAANVNTINSANVTVNSGVAIIDSFYANTYRSAKYSISSYNGVDAQFSDLILIQNSGSAVLSNVSNVRTGTNSVTYTANVNAGVVNLLAQGTVSANQLRIQRIYFVV